MKNSKYERILMKYYVDILYMIVNGVIISNNKNMIDKKIIKGNGLSNVKKGNGLSNVKSFKGSGLKILK